MVRLFYPTKLQYIYTPNVTWSLHHNIIADAGFIEKNFRYYSPVTKSIDIVGMLEDLENMEDEQVILLQTSAQNPSGCDPTREQWELIFEVVIRKQHFVFFDSAY